ncbi:MAG: ATP-binding protein [Bacteroidota bacterium]
MNLLRKRRLIYLGLGLVLFFCVLLNIRTYNEFVVSEKIALENAVKSTEIRSKYLSQYFEEAEIILTNLRSIMLNLSKADKFDRPLMNDMILSNLNIKNNTLSLWVYLEPNAFDTDTDHKGGPGSKDDGRYAPWFYYNIEKTAVIRNICGTDHFKFYEYPKTLRREVLLEPYQTVNGGDKYFITLAQPVIDNGFKGAMGIDWFWDDFNTLVTERPLNENSQSYLISEKGTILSHIDVEKLGKSAEPAVREQLKRVMDGEKLVEHNSESGLYRVITNFKIPYTETDWYIVNEFPDTNNLYSVIQQNKLSWRIGLLLFVLLLLLLYSLVQLFNFLIKDRRRIKSEFSTSIDSTYEGICIINSDYRYTQFNNAFRISIKYLLGVELQEGDHALDTIPQEFRAVNKINYDKALSGRFFIDEQLHKGRRYRHYYNPIFTDEKKVESFTVRIVDVTDKLKNEEELENYRENLQNIISDKTADLREMVETIRNTRLKLIENEKVATLGLLSSGLANELSNPVNFVVGNITPLRKDLEEINSLIEILKKKDDIPSEDLLQKLNEQLNQIEPDVLMPEINTLIEGIDKGALRVKEIVNNFNEFVRPDRQAKFEDINRGVSLAVEFIKPQLPPKVTLVTKLDPDLPSTYCDLGKLNDTLLTLINYSVSLISSGTITVTTSSNDMEYIVIMITNDQNTISEEEKNRILDPLSGIKGDIGDQSVRLALCKTVIEGHGGVLNIKDSVGGVGSAFIIKIPILIYENS